MSIAKKITLGIIILVIFICLTCGLAVYFMVKDNNVESDKLIKNYGNIEVFDVNNSKLELNSEYYVEYQNISSKIIDAFVSLEDKRFFKHNGLDYKRILGAMVKNIASFSYKEGASTISQQLIKNTHLSNKKTIKRKLIEAKLSLQLEKLYSKEEILEMYLNVIYFGNGIYGIDNAAKVIFNQTAQSVTLEQAATLAGIVKNPKKYSPLNNLSLSESRRNLVLKVMMDNAVITNQQYELSTNTPLTISHTPQKSNYSSQYYQNAIDEAAEILGISEQELMLGKYKILTYMDKELQQTAFNKMNSDLYNPYDCMQSALVIDNFNYGISAYSSNISQLLKLINRQYGSLLKPFSVYAAALENNCCPADKIMDEYINIDGYAPENYDKSYHGMVTIRESLIKSHNVPAVKLLQDIGLDNSLKLLKNIGFSYSKQQENLSIALGSLSGSPLTIAGAYAMLANNGAYSTPHFVAEIYDASDKLIYTDNNKDIKQIISPDSAYMLNDILLDCAKVGTASRLQYLPYTVAAKTGTVGDSHGNITDVWSCGYSSQYTTLSWQGLKENALPINYGGGGMPTMIVKDMMTNMPTPDAFSCPSTIKRLPINQQELELNNKIVYDKNSTYYEIFTNLNMPEINNTPIIHEDNGNLYLDAEIGSKLTILKLGIFGGEKIVFEGIVEDESIILDNYFDKSMFTNRYKIIIGTTEILLTR